MRILVEYLSLSSLNLIKKNHSSILTEKFKPEPGIEPRASRLMYKRSTTELSRSIHCRYLNLGFFLIT